MRDDGAALPALIVGFLLLLAVTVALANAGLHLAGRERVRTAAEAGALAAAPVTFRRFGTSGDPLRAASRVVAANGARLVSCRCPTDRSWDRRAVEVVAETEVVLLGLPARTVRAAAAAEFDPARLLVSGPRAAPLRR